MPFLGCGDCFGRVYVRHRTDISAATGFTTEASKRDQNRAAWQATQVSPLACFTDWDGCMVHMGRWAVSVRVYSAHFYKHAGKFDGSAR
jgi:hypothetical protein